MSAYYNENDPKAAAWLRELIKQGLIAPGDVDERSIVEVKPSDLTPYDQCHFFAGIGGWSLALRMAGVADSAPVWTGSCPCQPFSAAGKQRGEADERHLWPVFRQLIAAAKPAITFGEQVASKLGREWISRVRADLEALGYEFGGADLCAASVGAPHIRQRLWWMAHANGGHSSAEWEQRGWEQRFQPQDGVTNRLEHAESLGREQWWPESGRRGVVSECGISRLAYTEDGDGRRQQQAGESTEHRRARSSGGSRMGDPESFGRPGRTHDYNGGRRECAFRHTGAWSEFELVDCRDGKARRTEPGSFPLAHGVSGRVGLLRGYGNAIVPALAAEFIQAGLEAIEN